MSSEVAVSIRDLGKCYEVFDRPKDWLLQLFAPKNKRYYREFWALKGVTAEIRKGETVGIIGANGSGKSTLLQLICGTATASTGSVSSVGRIAALLELGSGFNPDFTGRENVYMNGAVLGLSYADIDARFDEIAGFAGIGDFMEQPTRTYSSGMIVRLAFAVSVCVEPDILVVDEALAVGDASFQFKCLNRLEELTARGTTLLFVSHDINMVKRFCHRALYLRKGELRAVGAPEEMSELYLLDMRDEQRRWASGGAVPVTVKPSLHAGAGIAFGTDEGRVLSACFTTTGGHHCSYVHGEEIGLRIAAAFCESVSKPGITLTIQDSRLIVISGQHFPILPRRTAEGWNEAHLDVRFKANLSPGRYHITLKLLDGDSDETSQLIEKQVGLLAFDMLAGSANFLGTVDLELEARSLDTPSAITRAVARTKE